MPSATAPEVVTTLRPDAPLVATVPVTGGGGLPTPTLTVVFEQPAASATVKTKAAALMPDHSTPGAGGNYPQARLRRSRTAVHSGASGGASTMISSQPAP